MSCSPTTPLSTSILQKDQFPWRLGTLITLAAAALAALSADRLAGTVSRRRLRVACMAVVLSAALYAGWAAPLSREHVWWARGWLIAHAGHNHLDSCEEHLNCAKLGREYRTATTPEDVYASVCDDRSPAAGVAPVASAADAHLSALETEPFAQDPRALHFRVRTDEPRLVAVRQWHFPGRTATTRDGERLTVGALRVTTGLDSDSLREP